MFDCDGESGKERQEVSGEGNCEYCCLALCRQPAGQAKARHSLSKTRLVCACRACGLLELGRKSTLCRCSYACLGLGEMVREEGSKGSKEGRWPRQSKHAPLRATKQDAGVTRVSPYTLCTPKVFWKQRERGGCHIFHRRTPSFGEEWGGRLGTTNTHSGEVGCLIGLTLLFRKNPRTDASF